MRRSAAALPWIALLGLLVAVGFALSRGTPDAAPPSSSSAPLPSTASSRAVLALHVLSADRPVAGATVVVLARGPHPPLGTTRTDAQGRAEIGGLPHGDHDLVVTHPSFATERRPLQLIAERVELTVELVRGARIAGTVLDARGAAVAEATVRVIAADSNIEHGQDTTDTRGEFEVPSLKIGSYRVYVRTGRHRPGERGPIELVEHGAVERVELRLEDGFTLSGRVVDAENNPVPGANVGSNDDGSALATADDLGRFELAGLAAGSTNLFATAVGFAPAQLRGVPVGGRNLEIVLQRPAKLSAALAFSRPVGKLVASLCRHDEHFKKEICVARRIYEPGETALELEGLPVGEHVLVVEAEGHDTARVPVRLSSGENFTVPLIKLVETTLSP